MLKLISLHLEAMMVPTTMELDISLTIQNAAVIALGLLYMGTRDGHVSKVLLDEIGQFHFVSDTMQHVYSFQYTLLSGKSGFFPHVP